jgi:hypothetical protein
VKLPERYNIDELDLTGLIVHELERGTTRQDPEILPTLSSHPAPRAEETLDFLNRQIRTGMADGSYPARFVDDPVVAAPGLLTDLLDNASESGAFDEGDLLKASRDLALTLQLCQEHNSPAGMFAMSWGTLQSSPILAVLKLESQRGLQLVRTPEADGVTIDLVVQPDLFVGNKAKLFKAATFLASDDGVRVMICDEQFEKRPSHPAAQFFVAELLGCTIDENLEVRTARFVDGVAQTANRVLSDADERAHVLTALRAEIGNQRKIIDPMKFIEDNFPEHKQADAEAQLRRASVDMSRFQKDTAKITKFLRKTTFKFVNGVTLVASEDQVSVLSADEAFDDDRIGVQVRAHGDQTTAVVRGRVDGVTPRS